MSGPAALIGADAGPAGKIICRRSPINEGRPLQAAFSIFEFDYFGSVRRETVQQAIAAGAPEIGLRAAAIRTARRMRAVPGFRRVIVTQANAVDMTEHR